MSDTSLFMVCATSFGIDGIGICARNVFEIFTVKEDLTGKTVAELRELAKAKEIKGYSTMKKAELIEALK